MTKQPYFLDWPIIRGGSRKGANITVGQRDSKVFIAGKVIAWLDADFTECTRAEAQYCLIQRWSYQRGSYHIPQEFAVKIDKPPKYNSKIFKPAERIKDV